MKKTKDYIKGRCYLSDETPEQLIEKCFKQVAGLNQHKEAKEMRDAAQHLLDLKKYVDMYRLLDTYLIIYGRLQITENGKQYVVDGNGITETENGSVVQ